MRETRPNVSAPLILNVHDGECNMNKPLAILLLFFLVATAGCSMSMTTLVETGPDGRKVYTKYYDGGGYLIEEDVAVIAVVEHIKENIAVLYDIQRALAMLGPGDLDAQGLVTLLVSNVSGEDYKVDITSISNAGGHRNAPENTLSNFNGQLDLTAEKPKASIVVGKLLIDNYGTTINLTIAAKASGKTYTKQFNAQRRTPEELEQFFGPNGKLPYPWVNK